MRPWLLPVVAWQGRRVRRTTPVLPEASGPLTGRAVAPEAARRGEQAAPTRLLVIGESTAAGVGVATHADGFTGRLADNLAASDSVDAPVEWTVVGRSGATLRRIRHRLVPAVPAGPYDVVVILAGVNDVLTGRKPADWAADLAAVLADLRGHLTADGRLVVTGVPPFAHFPSLPRPLATYLDDRGRALDAASATVCTGDARVRWLPSRDLMPAPREASPDEAGGASGAGEWFAADGFHPGARGYAQWARRVAEALSDAVIARFAVAKLDEMVAIIAALDDETANARPDLPGANSPYVLLTHCLGMMRYWSSDVNRGIAVPRDRDAEFVARGPVAELVERAGRVRAAFLRDCRAIDLAAAPADPPPDETEFWLGTAEGVLLHVVEELCQHLGHLELTRDILLARN